MVAIWMRVSSGRWSTFVRGEYRAPRREEQRFAEQDYREYVDAI
jgi:hypothetical protein